MAEVAALAAVAVLVVAGLAFLGTGQPAARQDPHRGTAGKHRGSNRGNASHGEKLVPASGAYLGAYIQPQLYTSQGEIKAIRSFEQRTGSPLRVIHVYRRWRIQFPTSADRYFAASGKLLLITWSGVVDTKKIIAGTYDALIRNRAQAVRKLGHPILLEFRHEMDRPNLQASVHGPRNFIAAWDHIRAIFAAAGAANVGWVWCPTGYGFANGRAQAFYPGNSQVDWVCADVYSASPAESLAHAAQVFLQWAAPTGKPVIIGEFGVGGNPAGWAGWLAAAGQLPLTDPQVKALVYFDANGTDSNGRRFRYWLGRSDAAVASFGRLMAARRFQPQIRAGP